MEYNQKAIWALICPVLAILVIVIVSFFKSDSGFVNPIIFLYYIPSIIGLALGFLSKKEINKNNKKGNWMSILSIILNILLILAPLIIFIIIVIVFWGVGTIY